MFLDGHGHGHGSGPKAPDVVRGCGGKRGAVPKASGKRLGTWDSTDAQIAESYPQVWILSRGLY